MSGLSVIVITRNEEMNLPRCLLSVEFADEIVVVDSGSSDRTVEIAREHGARVFSKAWEGYGKSKQHGLDRARGDWILSIDADEVVQPELAMEIRTAIAGRSQYAGYFIPRKTEFLGRWIMHSGWYPDPVLRLFRRDSGRFSEDAVHESVVLQGSAGRLDHDLLHYSYPSLENYFDKFNRYTSIAAREAYERGRRAGVYDLVVRPAAKFIKQYVIKRGFLDGIEGLILAVLSSCYVMVKYAKLWHLARTGAPPQEIPE